MYTYFEGLILFCFVLKGRSEFLKKLIVKYSVIIIIFASASSADFRILSLLEVLIPVNKSRFIINMNLYKCEIGQWKTVKWDKL